MSEIQSRFLVFTYKILDYFRYLLLYNTKVLPVFNYLL